MHPRTDIVVIVHNRLAITKVFIDRVFNNTEHFNLIFVDNGSTDGTVEFLEKGYQEGKWSLYKSPTNLGIIEGRNVGAGLIQTDYFVNIDNDQYPCPGWLHRLHDVMTKGFDIVGSEAWRLHPPDKGGSVTLDNKSYSMDYFPVRHCSRPNEAFSYIGCGGMLIKRKVYEEIGLFDKKFSPAFFEDPDFDWRALQKGYKLGWAHQCKIDHIGHQTISAQTLFNKNEQFRKSWKAFRDKWYPFYPEPMRM